MSVSTTDAARLAPRAPRTGFQLNNGLTIPAVGLGTFQADSGAASVKEVVSAALRKGYRHIDTAAAYGNEAEIGQAIRESAVPREELFITTKLLGARGTRKTVRSLQRGGLVAYGSDYLRNNTWHQPADVPEALRRSLMALQLDYVDLYLMHFPYAYRAGPDHSTLRDPSGSGKPLMDHELSRAYPDVWKAMESLVESGQARSIGLGNFNVLKTKRVLSVARIRPAVIQVELHPYLPQQELVQFCQQEGIHVTAHQPLGGKPIAALNPNAHRLGPLLDPHIAEIAAAYEKTPAQTILSWAVQRGVSVVPKTVHEDRLVENVQLFELNEEHLQRISSLAAETGTVRYLDPSGYVGFDIFDEEHDQPVAHEA